jgi:hypothetical protein
MQVPTGEFGEQQVDGVDELTGFSARDLRLPDARHEPSLELVQGGLPSEVASESFSDVVLELVRHV